MKETSRRLGLFHLSCPLFKMQIGHRVSIKRCGEKDYLEKRFLSRYFVFYLPIYNRMLDNCFCVLFLSRFFISAGLPTSDATDQRILSCLYRDRQQDSGDQSNHRSPRPRNRPHTLFSKGAAVPPPCSSRLRLAPQKSLYCPEK